MPCWEQPGPGLFRGSLQLAIPVCVLPSVGLHVCPTPRGCKAGGGTRPGWRTWSRQLHLSAFSSRIQCEIRIPHHLSHNFEPWPQQHVRAARPCSALCKELQLQWVQLLASSLGTVSFDVQPRAPALQPSGCAFWEQIYRLLICLPPSRLDVAVIRLRFTGVSETRSCAGHAQGLQVLCW